MSFPVNQIRFSTGAKKMIRKNFIKNDGGAVTIIEAVFVFPIMFIVLFLLIFLGNAFYVKSQVESSVVSLAIKGSNYCADPFLETLTENGSLPYIKDLDIQPYRYIFGGMGDVEKAIEDEIAVEFEKKSQTLFKGMKPNLKSPHKGIAKYNNYVVYSTFSVQLQYDITFPIRFLGASEPIVLTFNSRAEVPVNDSAEFIRNTDMVIDLLGSTKIGKGISDAFSKINSFISSFANK